MYGILIVNYETICICVAHSRGVTGAGILGPDKGTCTLGWCTVYGSLILGHFRQNVGRSVWLPPTPRFPLTRRSMCPVFCYWDACFPLTQNHTFTPCGHLEMRLDGLELCPLQVLVTARASLVLCAQLETPELGFPMKAIPFSLGRARKGRPRLNFLVHDWNLPRLRRR